MMKVQVAILLILFANVFGAPNRYQEEVQLDELDDSTGSIELDYEDLISQQDGGDENVIDLKLKDAKTLDIENDASHDEDSNTKNFDFYDEDLILKNHDSNKEDLDLKNVDFKDETSSTEKDDSTDEALLLTNNHAHGEASTTTDSNSLTESERLYPEEVNSLNRKPILGEHKGEHVDHGDIMFRQGEEEFYFGDHSKKDEKDQAKDATIYQHKRWPMPNVPYVVESSLGSSARTAIAHAIHEFNLKSCVRLIPRSSQRNYLSFYKGSGCWSYVGMSGGKQLISIGSGCEYKKTAVHEIMHAFGFFHEQSRPDRDTYVTIEWNNINSESMKHNFAKKSQKDVTTFGHGYDYRSVMHYSKTAFGKYYSVTTGWWPFRRTVQKQRETIKPKINTNLGQCSNCGMSKIDALQVNHMYCNSPKQTVVRSTLIEEMKRFMAIYNGGSNSDFRYALLNDLKGKYPTYYWTVSSYAAVSGYSNHAFIGYCGHVFRYFNRNVVACYSKKTAKVPSSSMRTTIANAALKEVVGRGCDAKSGRDRAWKKANSYGYKIAMIQNVRWGSGLRTSWYAHTKFFNYNCQGNHKSSLVIMFGTP